MTDQHWYVASVGAGGSSTAPDRRIPHTIGSADARRMFYCIPTEPERFGECNVERSLRDAGFDCYRPMMRKDIIHHRTKKLITRSFPLFTRYIFVRSNRPNLARLAACDYVAAILGVDGSPMAVPDDKIEQIMRDERDMVFDRTRAAAIKRKEIGRTNRETTRMKFPPGMIARVTGRNNSRHPFRGFNGTIKSVTARGKVKIIMDMLGGLVPVELDADDLVLAADLAPVDRMAEPA